MKVIDKLTSFRKIEEKRGITVTDSGSPEVKFSAMPANEMKTEPLSKLTGPNSSTNSRPSWDEDWGPTHHFLWRSAISLKRQYQSCSRHPSLIFL